MIESFEENMRLLDEIIEMVEAADTPFDRSLELYKQGMALAADCAAALRGAEAEVVAVYETG